MAEEEDGLGGQQSTGGLLRSRNLKGRGQQIHGAHSRDGMYDAAKLEPEGECHVVTWRNIEKTLWISLQHCYLTLLLQIELYLASDPNIVGQRVVKYQKTISRLFDRITRFRVFLESKGLLSDRNTNDGDTCSRARKEMYFVSVLQQK